MSRSCFTSQTGAASTNSYKFTGREKDGDRAETRTRARYYHPRLQRFISEDPIGFRGGDFNLYAYVRNTPLLLKISTGVGRRHMGLLGKLLPCKANR